jgi:hypothetical protein
MPTLHLTRRTARNTPPVNEGDLKRFSLRTLLLATMHCRIAGADCVEVESLMLGFFTRDRMSGMKRFSIRDLLFLVVIVALALGWSSDHRKLTKLCQRQETELAVFMTPQVR